MPNTLTEALARNRDWVVRLNAESTESSARVIPYAEIYRGSTGTMETPIEHMQQAGQDEIRRKRSP